MKRTNLTNFKTMYNTVIHNLVKSSMSTTEYFKIKRELENSMGIQFLRSENCLSEQNLQALKEYITRSCDNYINDTLEFLLED